MNAFLGQWILDSHQSRYELGQPPYQGIYTIEAEAERLKISMDWTTVEGQHHHQVYNAIPDGAAYPYTDNPAIDSFSNTLVDEKTFESVTTKNGVVVTHARRVLSDDGQTMTVTMSGTTPQGDPYTNLAIYRRN